MKESMAEFIKQFKTELKGKTETSKDELADLIGNYLFPFFKIAAISAQNADITYEQYLITEGAVLSNILKNSSLVSSALDIAAPYIIRAWEEA